MSRDEAIAVVEAYLNGLAKKDLSNVPFAADITFEGPRVPKLIGREKVVGFLTSILPLLRRIHLQQHLVDGEFVATMFEMETVNGTDKVVDLVRCFRRSTESNSFFLLSPSCLSSWIARKLQSTRRWRNIPISLIDCLGSCHF